MPNPNMSSPEMYGELAPGQMPNPDELQGLTPEQLEALGLPPQQADIMQPGIDAPGHVEATASDFETPAGDRLTDLEGDILDDDNATKQELADNFTEVGNGSEVEARKVAHQAKFVVEHALADIGMDANKVGGRSEITAQIEADLAEKNAKQQEAGGAAELSATQAKEIENEVLGVTARKAIEEIHKDPNVAVQLVENDPELAAKLAPVVAVDGQNGGISELAARQAGREILQSRGKRADINLPTAA